MVGYVLANGRYTLRSLIGRGGQGMVYLADEAGASEPVVVKILAPSAAANDQSLVRFGA
jgi:serine/threonine protein kinase